MKDLALESGNLQVSKVPISTTEQKVNLILRIQAGYFIEINRMRILRESLWKNTGPKINNENEIRLHEPRSIMDGKQDIERVMKVQTIIWYEDSYNEKIEGKR